MSSPESKCESVALAAHSHLSSVYLDQPVLIELIEFNGLMRLPPVSNETFVERLSKTIAGQQLSVLAAKTIWNRVIELQKNNNLDFTSFIETMEGDDLRECGLSFAKTKAIKGIVDGETRGDLDVSILSKMNHEELKAHLTSFWGVGNWTAEMMMLFYFKYPDVWSESDVGLKNALTNLVSIYPAQQQDIVSEAVPYRSYLSLHLWAGIDEGFFNAINIEPSL